MFNNCPVYGQFSVQTIMPLCAEFVQSRTARGTFRIQIFTYIFQSKSINTSKQFQSLKFNSYDFVRNFFGYPSQHEYRAKILSPTPPIVSITAVSIK